MFDELETTTSTATIATTETAEDLSSEPERSNFGQNVTGSGDLVSML
jgi:hypothetical protein